MIQELFDIIDRNESTVDKNFIEKAYNLAYEAHKDQRRRSGELYIIHPLEVACILAELNMDTDTIAAGILHDVLEDTDYTYEELATEFNEDVAYLVEGVTKLKKIKYKSKEEEQADNLRKMLLAMVKDIRIILIKLADRLHNIRTLKYMPAEKQKEKAEETLHVFAPLAHRLGISKIKWELEDLSLRYLDPEVYYALVKDISEKRVEREKYINQIKEELHNKLKLSNIQPEIEGRPKHFYSIYKKMQKDNKTLDQIFDLTAIRILVEDVSECYAVLGIVHTMYKPLPGRFKDYIAMPKPNMYQSIHTTVIGPEGKIFEIQIRTFDMHRTAEYGIAAHWKYKEGVDGEGNFEEKLTWIRDILEWQGETSDATEFMEAFKVDLFSDEVFVFTPRGDVINLPSGATAVDFAYRIHTDVGHKCAGAKVNGRIVPLDYRLKTGEIVEVISSASERGPSLGWLNFVKSNHAKSKIKSWFKKEKKEENISRGKSQLESEAKKQGCTLQNVKSKEFIESLSKKFNVRTREELYEQIGAGKILAATIISKYKGMFLADEISSEELLKRKIVKKLSDTRKDTGHNIIVKGLDNIMVRFAQCCNPIPGDDIIGYITKGRGVSIHRRDCKNIKDLIKTQDERIVEVSWADQGTGEFVAEIGIETEDRDGVLATIMQLFLQSKIVICALNAGTYDEGVAVINAKIRVQSKKHLEDTIKKIKGIQGVYLVYRASK